MPWCQSKVIPGALALAGVLIFPLCLRPQVPAPNTLAVTVEDSRGAVIAGARVQDSDSHPLGQTGSDGRLIIPCNAPCSVKITAPGFEDQSLQLSSAATIQLQLASSIEQVTVTAYRTPLSALESPVTTRVLTQEVLSTT